MNDSGYSVLLSRLIKKAEAWSGHSNGNATAEMIFAAALELLCGADGPLGDKEREELKSVSEYFAVRGADMAEALARLRMYIESNTANRIVDDLYLQRKTVEARVRATRARLETIPAGVLLSCFLRDPSDALLLCLEGAASVKREEGLPESEREEAGAKKAHHSTYLKELEERKDALKSMQSQLRGRQGARQERDKPEKRKGDAADWQEREIPEAPKESITSLVDVVKHTRAALLRKVFGQDNAVTVFTNGIFQGELISLLGENRRRPRATFLFAGPPGVGKTFLAESAAEVLKLPYMRFDMSEFSEKEGTVRLCGADDVYRDSQTGILTGFVSENPKCILLFDEIEKAHINVIHLFLQILDAGRLSDAKTRKEVSFADTIVIFTTNAGRRLYEEAESEDLSDLSRKVILKALEKDVNPETRAPFFPAAICSRFASGNVVMFNYLSAHNLREIAKSTITEQVAHLKSVIGIDTGIEENVYTALLFAEGGSADARMVRGRAQSFYNQELFELFRLIDSEKAKTSIGELERIRFTVRLPEGNREIRELFETPDDTCALLFAPERDVEWCRRNQTACSILGARSVEEGARILKKNDVQLVMLDLNMTRAENKEKFLNLEDIESEARNFLWYVREQHSGIPVYLMLREDGEMSLEEQLSFRRIGVQDFLRVGGEEERFAETMKQICERLHHRRSIVSLARANKLVSFETGQRLSEDGKEAEICLFDFGFITAVDAEDTKNVLSNVSRPDVSFDEVIGAEDAKRELKYFVQYLQNPKKYMGTGVSAPKGVLLYGPPGTGKTMLAKAMANEAGVTFLAAEGNQFLKKYVGDSPAAVHDLFRAARKYAPSVLFVDEIDAIAKPRTGSEFTEVREEILTAFLTEMDGFRADPSRPIFVLAATNFDVEPGRKTSLDSALLRRFDRRIFVGLPNREERIRFLRMQVGRKPIFHVSDEMLENLAIRSTGMSLAALASVLELSLRMVVQKGDLTVSDEVLEEAFETFNSGEVKKWDPSELERTARHEAGHALLSWLGGGKPSYLTVVPRSDYGGYMQVGDDEDKGLFTREELLTRIRVALGGRAAELVYYGEKDGLSTGARGDLLKATRIARNMVCFYGMDEDFGLIALEEREADLSGIKQTVKRILKEQMEMARALITENRPRMDALVEALMNDNSLTGREIDAILTKS